MIEREPHTDDDFVNRVRNPRCRHKEPKSSSHGNYGLLPSSGFPTELLLMALLFSALAYFCSDITVSHLFRF